MLFADSQVEQYSEHDISNTNGVNQIISNINHWWTLGSLKSRSLSTSTNKYGILKIDLLKDGEGDEGGEEIHEI